MSISKFHGVVKKCSCTNPEIPMYCPHCLCRGFLATCLACSGTGQQESPTYGGSGTFKSTCDKCGGKGSFPAQKPADMEDAAVIVKREEALARKPIDALSEAAEATFAEKVPSETESETDEEDGEEGESPAEANHGEPLPPIRPPGLNRAKWKSMTLDQRQELVSKG